MIDIERFMYLHGYALQRVQCNKLEKLLNKYFMTLTAFYWMQEGYIIINLPVEQRNN